MTITTTSDTGIIAVLGGLFLSSANCLAPNLCIAFLEMTIEKSVN